MHQQNLKCYNEAFIFLIGANFWLKSYLETEIKMFNSLCLKSKMKVMAHGFNNIETKIPIRNRFEGCEVVPTML